MNDWAKLRSRYASNRLYEQRKVIKSHGDFEEFKNYIIDCGGEIYSRKYQAEAIRFRINGEIGIVYEKGSGNLIAHNLGIDYQESIGNPIDKDNYSVFSWGLK